MHRDGGRAKDGGPRTGKGKGGRKSFHSSTKVLDNSFERHDQAPPLSSASLFFPGAATREKLSPIPPRRCNIIFSWPDRVEDEGKKKPRERGWKKEK